MAQPGAASLHSPIMVRRVAGALIRDPASIISSAERPSTSLFNKIYHPKLGFTTTDDPTTLVVATDGGYSLPKSRDRAFYGVYFGRNSPYNRSESFTNTHPHLPMTSSRAEYRGISHAADILSEHILPCHPKIRSVIFMFDSNDIRAHMGHKGSHGLKLMSGGDERRMVHRRLRKLEDYRSVRVRLFWIPREGNRDADRLAKIGKRTGGLNIGITETTSSPRPWSMVDNYNSTDDRVKKEIHLVLRRLEFPLVEDDPWTSSIRHFIMNRLSYQASLIPENEPINPKLLWTQLRRYYWLLNPNLEVPSWASAEHLTLWKAQMSLPLEEQIAYRLTWEELQLWKESAPRKKFNARAKRRLELFEPMQELEDLRPSIQISEDRLKPLTEEQISDRDRRNSNICSWLQLAYWREKLFSQQDTSKSKPRVEKRPVKQVVQALRPSIPIAVPLVRKDIIGNFDATPATLPGYQGKLISQHR